MHSRLLTQGSITVEADGAGRLTRDVVFSSPSAAGAVVQGTVSTNGRTAWVAEDGTTFADWESREQGVDETL